MSTEKTIVRINASSLVLSRCMLAWHRTIIDGYKQPASGANLVYGVAVHKFIDTMFKTEGRLDLARAEAVKAFNVPKYDNKKSMHLSDATHLLGSCYSLWEDYVAKDTDYELIKLNTKCWWCDGEGVDVSDGVPNPCKHCEGKGVKLQAATEVTFEIPYYEDEHIIANLCGTIDSIGKIKGGCYAIRDWKTTSSWDDEGYLDAYEMSAQLRFYVLSLKLMARLAPDSILGKIGSTRVGAFIDGIFIKPKASSNSYKRSTVFQFGDADLAEFEYLLKLQIRRLSDAIALNTWTHKEGILNGTCENKNKYSKCDYWFVCKAQDPAISALLLKKDFIQKPYDPLNHNL